MASVDRPKFLPSFLGALKEEVENEGFFALIPIYFLAFLGVSVCIALLLPDTFWQNDSWPVSTTVYSGILTFNGLVLTLGWTAFSRVHDIIISKKIGAYLLSTGLLNGYLIQVSFMHISQILAAIFSGLGLVSIILEFGPRWVDLVIFALCATFTMHGLKQAMGSIEMMNDLVWQASVYESSSDNGEKTALHAINGGKE